MTLLRTDQGRQSGEQMTRSRVTALIVCAVALGTSGALLPSAAQAGPSQRIGVAPPAIPTSVQPLLSGDLTSYQWMLDAVRAPQAWSASTGDGVTVAVIDTGVDSTQPDLQGQVVPGGVVSLALDGSVVVTDAPLSITDADTIGHGTHVAGIIAANDNGDGVTGIAPDARVMPVAFPRSTLNRIDAISFFDGVAAALDYAVAHGADVANLSLGGAADYLAHGPRTKPYFDAQARACQAVKAAQQAGTVVVVAAGNDGIFLNPSSVPAACDGALSVAAVGPDLQRAFFSSSDPTVRLAAPGLQVLSVASGVARGIRGGHFEAGGTSMAAPVVAGVAALVAAQHPGWSSTQVENAMTGSAADIAPPGRDPETGFGLVDASAAVGASAPAPKPADYVSVLALESIVDGRTSPGPQESVISWNTPHVHAVNGYTVSVFDGSGSRTYDVDGLQVRLTLDLLPGSWAQVTAHTTAGDVESFPTWLMNPFNVTENFRPPPKVRHVRVDRGLNGLRMTWRPPARNRDQVDRMFVAALVDTGRPVFQPVPMKAGEPFPRRAFLRTSRALQGHDIRTVVVVTVRRSRMFGGIPNAAFARGPFAAPRGLAIDRVEAAGPRGAEVTGSIPRSSAKRECHSNGCGGRVVLVRVRFGDAVGEVRTRLTASGVFHAVVWRPAGAGHLQLRAVGPGGAVTGPFQPYRVTSGR